MLWFNANISASFQSSLILSIRTHQWDVECATVPNQLPPPPPKMMGVNGWCESVALTFCWGQSEKFYSWKFKILRSLSWWQAPLEWPENWHHADMEIASLHRCDDPPNHFHRGKKSSLQLGRRPSPTFIPSRRGRLWFLLLDKNRKNEVGEENAMDCVCGCGLQKLKNFHL